MITKTYGFTAEDIGYMTLTEIQPYELAYRKEMELKTTFEEELAWLYGIYTVNAINSSVVGNSQWFSGKNHRFDYPKQPFNKEEKTENKLTLEQSEQIAVYEMQRMIKNSEEIGLPMSPE